VKYAINRNRAEWRLVDGESVIVNLETSYYYGLNRSGTLLWTALADRARSADELARELAEACGIDEARARGDVDALLADLTREDLLSEV
jgi:hypothetical protein